jgi:phospholipid-binding lipoprotein MlaA
MTTGPLRRIARWGVLATAIALAGCATTGARNPRDPLEPFNRKVTEFNEGVDAVLLKPVATVYRQNVPPLVRTGVANFFANLGDAWSFANSALQLRLLNATENFARFAVNTTLGIGGIFDVASEMNIERHKEDFGQTLGRWGVPAGPYIVLPIFGPSTLRDSVAFTVDRRYDLVHQIDPISTRNTLYALRAVDQRATLLRASAVLDQAALDKYTFTRDAFLQRRRAEIDEREDPEAGQALDPSAPPNPDAPAAPGAPASAPAR